MIKNTVEYKLISKHYGDRVAERSQVTLINHINEGLVVLDTIQASEHAKRAFCLHPLFQADADLEENAYMASFLDPQVLLLTMEYRSVANEFLSVRMDDMEVDEVLSAYGYEAAAEFIRLSPLEEVNQMLVADKVQNYKDFIKHHLGTHPRSGELEDYFNVWLNALDVSPDMFLGLCTMIDVYKH